MANSDLKIRNKRVCSFGYPALCRIGPTSLIADAVDDETSTVCILCSARDRRGVRAARAARHEAKILAGGQSLMPLLSLRLARPGVIVDINRLANLAFIRTRVDGGLTLGALT